MPEVLLNPVGGLANRMRAMASGLNLCSDLNISCEIVWPVNKELHCCFEKLFKCVDNITVKNINNLEDLYFYDSPRKKNLYLSRLFQKSKYSTILTDEILIHDNYIDDPSLFLKIKTSKYNKVLIRSGLEFYNFDNKFYRKLFQPHQYIENMAISRLNNYDGACIGLHVRRSDNIISISNSPLYLFFDAIESEIEKNDNARFYLATDSDDVKDILFKRYGSRLSFSQDSANRNTEKGIIEALVEMITLSKCSKIYGSYWSSYSEAAALLGEIPLIQLKK